MFGASQFESLRLLATSPRAPKHMHVQNRRSHTGTVLGFYSVCSCCKNCRRGLNRGLRNIAQEADQAHLTYKAEAGVQPSALGRVKTLGCVHTCSDAYKARVARRSSAAGVSAHLVPRNIGLACISSFEACRSSWSGCNVRIQTNLLCTLPHHLQSQFRKGSYCKCCFMTLVKVLCQRTRKGRLVLFHWVSSLTARKSCRGIERAFIWPCFGSAGGSLHHAWLSDLRGGLERPHLVLSGTYELGLFSARSCPSPQLDRQV